MTDGLGPPARTYNDTAVNIITLRELNSLPVSDPHTQSCDVTLRTRLGAAVTVKKHLFLLRQCCFMGYSEYSLGGGGGGGVLIQDVMLSCVEGLTH